MIPVLEEAVVTADAYLLFYQKSTLNTTNNVEPKAIPSTSSISSGYLSSITYSSNLNLNHWAYQMPPFNYYNNGNNGNNGNGNGKSDTLPNRKVMQHKTNSSAHNNNSSNNNINISNISTRSNINSKQEATKHSNNNTITNNIQMNGNKKVNQMTESRNNHVSNHYNNNTFPRIKSRQPSH